MASKEGLRADIDGQMTLEEVRNDQNILRLHHFSVLNVLRFCLSHVDLPIVELIVLVLEPVVAQNVEIVLLHQVRMLTGDIVGRSESILGEDFP
jgi:hypothetical protein